MTTCNNIYDILASNIAPDFNLVKYWADLSSNPNGGDLKYYNHEQKKWVLVNNQATTDIKALQADVTELQEEVVNKADKVEGKELSTNDYTTEEKTKLAGLENYDDTELRASIASLTERVAALEATSASTVSKSSILTAQTLTNGNKIQSKR